VLANVRAVADATARISAWPVEQQFHLDGVSVEGVGHRFIDADNKVKIDVLAPDGLDPRRARLTTVWTHGSMGSRARSQRASGTAVAPPSPGARVALARTREQADACGSDS
jgi:hypothetical protein